VDSGRRLRHEAARAFGSGAADTLPRLLAEGSAPFDLIFIDADKQSMPEYFDWALRLSRRGTLIIVDNVVRDGAILDATGGDASV